MKVEMISSNQFSIFLNSTYLKTKDFDDKDKIIDSVKSFVKKVRKRLRLSGFYKLKVFVNKNVGIFIDALKIDSVDYTNVLDLRVIVLSDEKIFFETDDYFLISDLPRIRYFHNKFYCQVDDMDDIYKYIEFGSFIYGNDAIEMLNKSILI